MIATLTEENARKTFKLMETLLTGESTCEFAFLYRVELEGGISAYWVTPGTRNQRTLQRLRRYGVTPTKRFWVIPEHVTQFRPQEDFRSNFYITGYHPLDCAVPDEWFFALDVEVEMSLLMEGGLIRNVTGWCREKPFMYGIRNHWQNTRPDVSHIKIPNDEFEPLFEQYGE